MNTSNTTKNPVYKTICIVADESPVGENKGGAGTYLYQVAKILIKQNIRIHYVYNRNDFSKMEEKNMTLHGIGISRGNVFFHIYRIIKKATARVGIPFPLLPISTHVILWNWINYQYLRKLNKEIHFDYIITFEYNAQTLFLSFILHVPIAVFLVGWTELAREYNNEKTTVDSLLKSFLEKMFVLRCKKIFTISKQTKDHAQRWLKLKNPTIELAPIFQGKVFRKSNITKNGITFLFLGRIEYRKGPDLLLDAFIKLAKRYRDARLMFVGKLSHNFTFQEKSGYTLRQIVKLMDIDMEIRKRITFGEPVPFERLGTLFNNSTVLVAPSRFDPLHLGAMHALTAGVPILVSKTCGISEILSDNKNGFVVAPETQALEKKMAEIINCMSLNKIGVKGKKLANTCTDSMFANFLLHQLF